MLSNTKVFNRRMRRVISELGMWHHSFDLRAKIEVVVRLDRNKLRVLHQSRFKADFKVLAVRTISSQRVIFGGRIMITGADCRHKNQIVHFRKLLQLLPILPGREVIGAIRGVVVVEAVKVWLTHDCFAFFCPSNKNLKKMLKLSSVTRIKGLSTFTTLFAKELKTYSKCAKINES